MPAVLPRCDPLSSIMHRMPVLPGPPLDPLPGSRTWFEVPAESGRGMAVVASLSREWGVERDPRRTGKAVWAELPR